ncbi:unnamed protein product, partial [Hapterophycus canaliculatus]
AAEGGNLRLVEYLMIAGVDPNGRDLRGNTPLLLAAGKGHEKVVFTLLRRGASTEVANSEGQHALHAAVNNGHVATAEELLRAGADPNFRYGENDRHSPLQLGRYNTAMMKALFKHGADVNEADKLGYTALHWACVDAESATIDALIEAGAHLEARSSPNVNVKDHKGSTPLHLVCKSSVRAHSAEVADFLLRRGADETVSDKNGHLAVDIIGKCMDDAAGGRLKRLLVNAPTDRTWRRRGMLVMCRS